MATGDSFRYEQVDPEAAEKMNCRPKNGNHRIGEFPDPKFENLTNNIFVNVFEVRFRENVQNVFKYFNKFLIVV